MSHSNAKINRLIQYSTDVIGLSDVANPLTQIPTYSALEYFHHEGEHRAREGSVPTPFRGLITNKSMLCLNLQDLVIGPNHELQCHLTSPA